MRVARYVVSLCLALASTAALSFANQIDGRVIKVVDGDTIDVLDSMKRVHRIRFHEVDAPERSQAFGKKSTKSLSELAYGKHVQATCTSMSYERPVCRVWADGLDLNLIQVQRGMAWAADGFARDPRIIEAHRAAKAQRLGLWIDKDPIPPWVWRKQQRALGLGR